MSSVEQPQTSSVENQEEGSESIISVTEGSDPIESNSEETVFSFGEDPGEAGDEEGKLDFRKKKKKKDESIDEDEEEDEWSKFTF